MPVGLHDRSQELEIASGIFLGAKDRAWDSACGVIDGANQREVRHVGA